MCRDASTALDVSMRFSDGVPVAPYCFICRRRGADARATDGWLAERGSQREGAQTTAGLVQLLALSPRQRARGQIDNSDAGYVQRGQRCGCAYEAEIASVLQVASSFLRRELTRPLPAYALYSISEPFVRCTRCARSKRDSSKAPRGAPAKSGSLPARLATRARASEPPQLTRHL